MFSFDHYKDRKGTKIDENGWIEVVRGYSRPSAIFDGLQFDGLHMAFYKSPRGVTTAGDTGDASPVRPTMSPYIKMTTDSLSSELTFDE